MDENEITTGELAKQITSDSELMYEISEILKKRRMATRNLGSARDEITVQTIDGLYVNGLEKRIVHRASVSNTSGILPTYGELMKVEKASDTTQLLIKKGAILVDGLLISVTRDFQIPIGTIANNTKCIVVMEGSIADMGSGVDVKIIKGTTTNYPTLQKDSLINSEIGIYQEELCRGYADGATLSGLDYSNVTYLKANWGEEIDNIDDRVTSNTNALANKADKDDYIKLSKTGATSTLVDMGYMNSDSKQLLRINNYVNSASENTMVYYQMFPTATSGTYTQNGIYMTPTYIKHQCNGVDRRIAHQDQTTYVMDSKAAKLSDSAYKNKTIDYVFWDIQNKCRANSDSTRESRQYIFSDTITSEMPNFRGILASYLDVTNTVFNIEMVVADQFHYSNVGLITITTDDGEIQDMWTLMYNNISADVTATVAPENEGECIAYATQHFGGITVDGSAEIKGNTKISGDATILRDIKAVNADFAGYIKAPGAATIGGKATIGGEAEITGTIRGHANLELPNGGSIYLKKGATVKQTADGSAGSVDIVNVQNIGETFTWYEQIVNNTLPSAAVIRNVTLNSSGDWQTGYNINTGNTLGGAFTFYYEGENHAVVLNTTRLLETQTLTEIAEQVADNFEARISALEEDNARIMQTLGLTPNSRKMPRMPKMKMSDFVAELMNQDEERRVAEKVYQEQAIEEQKIEEAEKAKANKIAQDEAIAQAQAEELAKDQQEQHIAKLEKQMQLMQQELDTIKKADNDTIE